MKLLVTFALFIMYVTPALAEEPWKENGIDDWLVKQMKDAAKIDDTLIGELTKAFKNNMEIERA